MSEHMKSRRSFLKASMATVAASAVKGAAQNAPASGSPRRPNIILYLADQFRWDFVGSNGYNCSTRTPNLDQLAKSGVSFTHAVTNQPVCSPSRSVMITSRYATETGIWENGWQLDHSLPTIAGELSKAGYSTNMIGKWHLCFDPEHGGVYGPVKPENRGGFVDFWEAANMIEDTTHPYWGTIWDRDGREVTYKDQYRVDFITDRTEYFLRQKHEKPFFLFVSQLEPHQQEDLNPPHPVAPNGAAARYVNSTVPEDLRFFTGTWQDQLPDYYGCVEAIDTSVGRIVRILQEEHLADNTLFIFISDHGCHFMTRNREYKRSTHDSSIRVPLIFNGPGVAGGQQITELVGLVDLAPTLLEAAGVPIPSSWKGSSFLPLINNPTARLNWPNEQLIQISESMTGRAICTKEWTYCIVDPSGDNTKPAATHYREYQFYDQRADPNQLVNLAGRKEYRQQADHLMARLKKLMVTAGEAEPQIEIAKLYP